MKPILFIGSASMRTKFNDKNSEKMTNMVTKTYFLYAVPAATELRKTQVDEWNIFYKRLFAQVPSPDLNEWIWNIWVSFHSSMCFHSIHPLHGLAAHRRTSSATLLGILRVEFTFYQTTNAFMSLEVKFRGNDSSFRLICLNLNSFGSWITFNSSTGEFKAFSSKANVALCHSRERNFAQSFHFERTFVRSRRRYGNSKLKSALRKRRHTH